jgi:exodeoxyribonuclease V alpha subunit
MSSFRPKPPAPPPLEVLARNEFEGYYRHVTHTGDDGSFKIVTFRTNEGVEFKAKGNFFGAAMGEPLRIRGQWREHAQYGWSFQMDSFISTEPSGAEAILAYLGSGLIKGVRISTAKKIVDHFGDRTLEVLDSAPELLREVKGVTSTTLRKIVDQWQEQRANREVLVFLKSVGLSNAIALRLIRHYGENAANVLKLNPYQVGLDVKHIGFVKADEIAGQMGIAKDSPMRVQAAFVHLLDQASAEGHTFLPQADLLERATTMLAVERTLAESCLEAAVAQRYILRLTIPEAGVCFFMPSLYKCERGLLVSINGLIRSAKPLLGDDVDVRIAAFETKYRFALAPMQRAAIRDAVSGGIIVITGGPGTGKTTLVRGLLSIIEDQPLRVALCSPTGRAAQRLSETTRQEASTIHRLLKWNAQTGRFVHGPDNLLPLDLLIVDEASMVDVPLAYNLLRAIPDGATVVFVGDVDQLPSVGPGTFLRDLIGCGRLRVARLDVIFRQGHQSLIVENAHRINGGRSLSLPEPDDRAADFYHIARDEVAEVVEATLAMATERVPKRLACDPVDGVQILTPMRMGPLGTGELNRVLQEKLNPNGAPLFDGSRLRLGDKVMQSSNNYDLDVYNGDVGRITGFNSETREVSVLFGRRPVHYPLENLDELELAYALTIHKSQGSEYPAVVVLLHTSHYIMLKRNLLYTAVTRGKKLVLLIGAKRAVYRAINTSTETERLTALGVWLRFPPEKEDLLES